MPETVHTRRVTLYSMCIQALVAVGIPYFKRYTKCSIKKTFVALINDSALTYTASIERATTINFHGLYKSGFPSRLVRFFRLLAPGQTRLQLPPIEKQQPMPVFLWFLPFRISLSSYFYAFMQTYMESESCGFRL